MLLHHALRSRWTKGPLMAAAVFFSLSSVAWAQAGGGNCGTLLYNGSANGGAGVINEGNPMVEHAAVPAPSDWNQPDTAQQGHNRNSQVDGIGALVGQVVPQAITSLGGIGGLLTGLLGAAGGQGGKFAAAQGNRGCDVVQGCKNPTTGCPATSPTTGNWAVSGQQS